MVFRLEGGRAEILVIFGESERDMIKSLQVKNLYGRFDFDLQFNEDLNLFTGRNGSGKTTLMKLMWGMLSERIKADAPFLNADLILMEAYGMKFFQGTTHNALELGFKDLRRGYDLKANKYVAGLLRGNEFRSSVWDNNLVKWNDTRAGSFGRTLFFPTFRRSEGGFNFLDIPQEGFNDPLKDIDLAYMINTLLNQKTFYRVFVNYSASSDINYFLTSIYSGISSQVQKLEKAQSDFILKRVSESHGDEKGVLEEIRRNQVETNQKVEALMQPINNISKVVSVFYHGKGIKIGEGLTLGDTADAIQSEHLSSGEKQMLSFLTYCTACKDTIIFIDEPELSLHPDWQRLLLPTLLDIPNGNQYFIATHSPFIYANYPDKEINLDQDRGGE